MTTFQALNVGFCVGVIFCTLLRMYFDRKHAARMRDIFERMEDLATICNDAVPLPEDFVPKTESGRRVLRVRREREAAVANRDAVASSALAKIQRGEFKA